MREKSSISEGKLTKTFFMNLAPGLYLARSEANDGAKPVFEQVVSRKKDREAQWKAITQARANDKICYVAESKAEFDAWEKARSQVRPGPNAP